MSERTFRRWRDRFEADGADGLYDRRLGRVSARRAPVDEVARVLALFDTRYGDFTAKHFHEKLVAEHGCTRSDNWVRLTLQARGRMRPAPRRGAHRRKRPRRALPGMLVHQDGSRHEWVPGCWWDLIVTMDDATSETYSAFFVDEEGCQRRDRPGRGDGTVSVVAFVPGERRTEYDQYMHILDGLEHVPVAYRSLAEALPCPVANSGRTNRPRPNVVKDHSKLESILGARRCRGPAPESTRAIPFGRVRLPEGRCGPYPARRP